VQRENLFERGSQTVTAAKETVLGVLLPYFNAAQKPTLKITLFNDP
jgi:hypothetical protein